MGVGHGLGQNKKEKKLKTRNFFKKNNKNSTSIPKSPTKYFTNSNSYPPNNLNTF